MEKARLGYNQGNIQNMNRTLLLKLLRKEEVCARIRLAELSGLKQATVTHIINDFMDWKLVREIGHLTGSKGRRSIAITLNTEDFLVAGIRIARKDYSVGLFNIQGESVMIRRGMLHSGMEPEEILSLIICQMKKIMESYRDKKILAMGAAIPGPYSYKKGHIQLMTGIGGWNKINLGEELKKYFSMPIFVEQDANAAAMAQYWYSDERPELLVYIAVGQGVGAGIVSGDELLIGCGGSAGEIGHTSIDIHGPRCSCGNYGCLENFCSSIAFTKKINEVLQPEQEMSFQEAVLLVKKEEPRATEIFLELCDYLSVGVVNVINTFNPQVIVIGDEMSHILPEKMLERVVQNVKGRVVPEILENTQIRMSLLEHDSMVHGAAIVAIRKIFEDPEQYFTGVKENKEGK